MKNRRITLSLFIGLLGFSMSAAFAQSKVADLVEEKENGRINWTGQYIEATGMSAIDNTKFKIPAQAQMMAQRGAVVVAQRNLLEIVEGVKVTSTTTVKDYITESDVIVTEISGVVKGAQMVGKPKVFDTHVEVTLRMPIYAADGIAPVLAKNAFDKGSGVNSDLEQEAQNSTEDMLMAIGLKFLNGEKISPSMFPKFVDEEGNTLIDLAKVYDPAKGSAPAYGKMPVEKPKDGKTELIDVAVDSLGNFVVSKIEKPKLRRFVKGLIDVSGVALKILL